MLKQVFKMKVIIFSNLYQFLIFTLFFKILHFQLIYYEKSQTNKSEINK